LFNNNANSILKPINILLRKILFPRFESKFPLFCVGVLSIRLSLKFIKSIKNDKKQKITFFKIINIKFKWRSKDAFWRRKIQVVLVIKTTLK